MNPDNYCTLSAAKRLHEAGIVIETEAWWARRVLGNADRWELTHNKSISLAVEVLPAPCMAEVWWELPETIQCTRKKRQLHFEKWRGESYASYENYGLAKNINPTDALIDLKIWTVKEKKS
jgi:hypothetical protein